MRKREKVRGVYMERKAAEKTLRQFDSARPPPVPLGACLRVIA